MKKALITAIVIAALLLAAAVGVLVYLQTGNGDHNGEKLPAASETTPAENPEGSGDDQQEPQQTTEETVGISLPTEDPDEVGPAYTWPEDEEGTGETAAPADPDATYDPDENETPPMPV